MRPLLTILLCCALSCAATFAAPIVGHVFDPSGRPVPGAEISARLTFTEFSNDVSGPGGEFQLDLPTEQAHTAFITCPGYLNTSVEIPKRQSANPFSLTIHLTPQSVITGIVTDEDGLPVAGADVAALSYQFIDGKRVLSGNALTIFQTDDSGRYRIFGLQLGTYFVRVDPSKSLGAWDNRYHTHFFGDTLDPVEQNRITVAAGEEKTGVDIHLHRHSGVEISGQVRFPRNTKPPAGVGSIDLYAAGLVHSFEAAQISPDGRFIFTHILPGDYTLRYQSNSVNFRDGDLVAKELPIKVAAVPIQNLSLDLHIANKVDLQGKVTFENNLMPRKIAIAIDPPDFEDLSGGSAVSDGAGSFVLKGLRPRHYNLRIVVTSSNGPVFANSPGYLFPSSIVLGDKEVLQTGFDLDGSSDPGELHITMSANGAVMRGRALLKNGSPRVRASVWLMPENSNLPICVSTDENGYFSLNIPPGNYNAYFFDNNAGPNDPNYFVEHKDDYPTLHLKSGPNPPMTLQ